MRFPLETNERTSYEYTTHDARARFGRRVCVPLCVRVKYARRACVKHGERERARVIPSCFTMMMMSQTKLIMTTTSSVTRRGVFQKTRRGTLTLVDAKKKRRGGGGGGGGGGSDDYASDFALYGSFDESYAEGAGMLLGKKELNSASGKRRGGSGSSGGSYDAVAGVLEALAEERRSRNKYRRDDYDEEYYDDGEEEGEYYEEEEETINGTDSPSSDAQPRQQQSTPQQQRPRQQQQRTPEKPKPQPQRPRPTAVGQAKANAQPKASTDPAETRAKALTTMQKWGFAQSDLEAALDATSASVGDAATAKKRQVAALDWLLVNCPMDAVPDEYKLEAQQARA
jgi:hypothetical protein